MSEVNWSYYDKFEDLVHRWMPDMGEGDNAGSQAVTAVNKLVYKWYNDGDVFDNTHNLEGWCNDLSSYANWLHKHADGCSEILERIFSARSDGEYELLLRDLADLVLDTEYLDVLKVTYGNRIVGSIYDCDGPFEFDEP